LQELAPMPSIAAIALHSLPKELPPPTCTQNITRRFIVKR
jgi:hypothetical protein